MSRVTVTIDRLVLRGVDPVDAQALVGALKADLARTFAESASRLDHARSRSVAVARGVAPAFEPGLAGARKLAAAAARAIGKEVGR